MHGRLLVMAIELLDRERGRDVARADAARRRREVPLEPIRPGAFAAWAARGEHDGTGPLPAELRALGVSPRRQVRGDGGAA